jgi:prepilin-type N-terminal cleavage/methylation domain-containing protein/prepilin-type processing-associated H-X9-DG protein
MQSIKFAGGFPAMTTKILQNTSQTKSDANRKGFTLIELLVVIAIIALLAAILFPVFARARENARKSSCMNGQKQIGVGLMQYVQDFDERYVFQNGDGLWVGGTAGAPIGTPAGLTFVDFLHPYIKSEQVWKCASSPRNGDANARISFHMNGCMNGTSLADVSSTAKTLMFRDPGTATSWNRAWLRVVPVNYTSNDCNGSATGTNNINAERGLTGGGIAGQPGPHFEGYNVVYADGHVKWLARTDFLLTPPNAKVVFSPDGLK